MQIYTTINHAIIKKRLEVDRYLFNNTNRNPQIMCRYLKLNIKYLKKNLFTSIRVRTVEKVEAVISPVGIFD